MIYSFSFVLLANYSLFCCLFQTFWLEEHIMRILLFVAGKIFFFNSWAKFSLTVTVNFPEDISLCYSEVSVIRAFYQVKLILSSWSLDVLASKRHFQLEQLWFLVGMKTYILCASGHDGTCLRGVYSDLNGLLEAPVSQQKKTTSVQILYTVHRMFESASNTEII